ncbi:hypothetical protein BC629DRAFT_160128 [Irpex lacteus]|nr:hypothetical protein BC629DRAFT_160128 [Irpex lacteus]
MVNTSSHSDDSANVTPSPPSPAHSDSEATMRATFSPSRSRQSTPTSPSQELDAPTPRQSILTLAEINAMPPTRPEDSGPVIYDSAVRRPGSAQEEHNFASSSSSREPLRAFGSTGEYLFLCLLVYPLRLLPLFAFLFCSICGCRALPCGWPSMVCGHSGCDRISAGLCMSELEKYS